LARAGEHLPRVEVDSREAWRGWLEANHGRTESVWVVTWKKADPERHVPYGALVEEALAFGWIDSLPRKLDEARSMLLMSPRKAGSAWSAANKARVERLTTEGRMAPAGLAAVDRAKADGSWSKLDAVEALEIPDDLARAFGAHPGSRETFEAFPRSVRRGVLEWIEQAKRPETRARRVEETARLAAENRRAAGFDRTRQI
jgi:uncharacterized protein YdeI (YjbR/CyaY-like superfamily)